MKCKILWYGDALKNAPTIEKELSQWLEDGWHIASVTTVDTRYYKVMFVLEKV